MRIAPVAAQLATPIPAPTPTSTSPLSFLNSGDPLTQILVSIAEALLILLVAIVLAGFFRAWVVRLLRRSKVNIDIATLVGNLVQIGTVLIGIVTALPVIGVQWASLVAVLGVAGLAISLSLQDLLKNVVAGIYILMEQPFRIGDRVSVRDVTGVVLGIELRTTLMRTDDHLQVVVPNNIVLNEIITNRSASNLVRTTVQLRIKQATIADVISRIKAALAANEDVAESPEPVVTLEGVFEGVSRIRIDFWAPTARKGSVTTSVVEALQAAFPTGNLKVVA